MSEYAIERRSTSPKNFFAGDFPTLTDTGTAGAAIAEYTPVTVNDDGEIVPVAAATVTNVIGIAAAEAAKDEPVVYYLTGEFFAAAINLPTGVEIAALKSACRKVSIFLR